MPEFESLAARITAENAAIKQMFDFASTEPHFAPDATIFREQTEYVMDSLALTVQGIARLCPETAQMFYEAQATIPPHQAGVTSIPGWPAYNFFINRHTRFREDYFEAGTSPFLEVSPSSGSLKVYASYMPSRHEVKSSVEIVAEDSVGTQNIEGSTELNPDKAAFTYRNKDDYTGLVLSRKPKPEAPYLNGRPTTNAEVAATLYDPSMVRAFEEGGPYGLGSYLVWRSVRNLQELVELPPNKI